MNLSQYIAWFQTQIVDPVLNGPTWITVYVLCLFGGAIYKRIPEHWVPNKLVPILVWVTGGGLMMFLGPLSPALTPARQWRTRNLTVGLLVGFTAWLSHRYLLKPAIRFALSKFPWIKQDTTFTTKPPKP